MKKVYETFLIAHWYFVVEQVTASQKFEVKVIDKNDLNEPEFWLSTGKEDAWLTPSGWRLAILQFCEKKMLERRKIDNPFTITQESTSPF